MKAKRVPSTVLVMLLVTLAFMFSFTAPVQAADDGYTDLDRFTLTTIGVGAAAVLSPSPAGWATIATLGMLSAGDYYPSDCPKARYNAPGYKLDKGGYVVEVTACDYDINKAKYSQYDATPLTR